MTLKVIGAGFGRTGTLSFKTAMEKLGFAKCHHMTEVIINRDQAPRFAAAARGELVDWDEVYDGYQSCCDWPSCHFWRELTEFYPDAKVVLTVRNAESWYKSMDETVLAAMRATTMDAGNPMAEMGNEIILKQTFDGDLDNRDRIIETFERHNQAVREGIPPERLLEFEARMGWEPLCVFLGVPVPDEAYPNSNALDEFNQIVQSIPDRIPR